ncbi:MAG TPA: YceI family protein, partial [Planctomycetota bacterium]|nr:YceI family protein [Planctomycetota bacterium]
DTAHHPEIVFQLTGFVPDQDGIDKTRRQVHGAVVGQMAIHGVTRELRMQVTLRVDDSQRLVLDGQVPLELSDYEITVPSQLGVISVNDEVKLWIALRARVQAGGHDAK